MILDEEEKERKCSRLKIRCRRGGGGGERTSNRFYMQMSEEDRDSRWVR